MKQFLNQLTLTDEEVRPIKALLAETMRRHTSVDDTAFLGEVCVIAHELPRRVRLFLNDFKHQEPPSGHCLISGYPVDQQKIGLTPAHWKSRQPLSPTLEEEMLMVLYGSLLGEVIGWTTQQDGYIVHDVLPIKADENAQIGTGSEQTIWWHNEDAFHPYRGDYVGLFCLRNPDSVATTFASMDMIQLSRHQIKLLFEPHFIIRPDASHDNATSAETQTTPVAPDDAHASAYRHLQEMKTSPENVAILFGDPQAPYIRIDPYFMDPLPHDEAQGALNALIRAIDGCLSEVILQPGDCLFIDNYRAVHGRKSFHARYDGTDRWLKRTNITRDLRKSRSLRATADSQVIL